MKSASLKRVNRRIKKWISNVNTKFVDNLFRKELSTYENLRTYIHIYEELFPKTSISELGIYIANSIFGLVLNAFWERVLQMYPYIKRLYIGIPLDAGTIFKLEHASV